MRICHIITTISRGGAENQLLLLAKKQAEAGNSVTIMPLKGTLDLFQEFVNSNVVVDLRFYMKKPFQQVLISLTHKFRIFNIVHLHLPQAELLGIFLRSRSLVSTRHFGDQFYPNRNKQLSLLLSRLASIRPKYIIAISNFVCNYLEESREIIDPRKIKLIPYGFDKAEFIRNSDVVEVTEISKVVRFGTLSRLSPEKDLRTIIEAFRILKVSCCLDVQFEVKIFGDGPLRNLLQKQIEDSDLTSEVSLMGKTLNSLEAISQLDCFILASKYEGFGMVLLEAMALHRPILCSDISTTREVLGSLGAASYFKVGDPSDLASKICNLDDYILSNFRIAQDARLESYNADKMTESVQMLYTLMKQ